MKRTLLINAAGLGAELVSQMPALARLAGRGACAALEPILPATTCPMQATLTTGEPPARHGITANGLYFHDTAEVRFWEQSARLVLAPRVWELAPKGKRPKTAMLFWQQSLYGTADLVLTPKPVHGPRGELVQDCWSRPADLYARLVAGESALAPGCPRGPFNLMHYWGPMAGIGSSRWIADAALEVWRTERPDLALVYLPHLDYSGHRAGPASDAHRAAARELDALLAPLLAAAEEDGARRIVLSEYSFVPVARPVAPNRALREVGMLALREVAGAEYLHCGDSRAFALVDNQVAHIYFPATEDLERDVRRARAVLERLDGVAAVLDREAQSAVGLDHVRSGELVLLAQSDAHFTYYWWLDDSKAPPFARTVDIHAKPGFDAAELFIEPAAKTIPLSAEGVRGSHGLVPEDGRGWGVLVDSDPPPALAGRKAVRATEVAHFLVPDVTG
ncbi:MAG: nucleotide pyrophosphatase/phosphodiesterase family protein [Phycisphaerae bacterium]|nr:alkaline phosphatase family protein [Phycisphaerae bacterium]